MLTLACASVSMTNIFFPNFAESVSASASTSVDFPALPLAFITAIELRNTFRRLPAYPR
jgi:hypothetical protein